MTGTLVYKGKTKDVYQAKDGNYLLKFKDDVTGENGVFDPGANTVGLKIEGMGKQNLKMSRVFFELLHDKGIKTHYLSCDPEENTMLVRAARPFGQGLEVICRLRAVGSFLRRYGAYVEEGAPLDYYVETTLKDDAREDPLITREALRQLHIMSLEQYDEIERMTKDITRIIERSLKERGLDLYDIKLEFGLSAGEVILMDEISSGNMRVYRGGEYMHPLQLTARIVG